MKFANARLRNAFPEITESRYTIIGVSEAPPKAPYPSIVLQISKDDACTKHSMLIPLPNDWNDINPHTNFGRLIQAYGKDDTENWLGNRVEIRIDEQNRKHVFPINNRTGQQLAAA